MTLRYRIALAIVAISTLAGFLMTERVIGQHETMLEIVNISGRQRMLSQRTALLVERLVHVTGETERLQVIALLTEATDMLEQGHRRLTDPASGKQAASPLRSLYFAGPDPLNDRVLSYIAALRAAAASPESLRPEDAVRITGEALGPLLARLEEMVARYQEDGEAGFQMLHRLGLLALFLTLTTLAVEAAVIFGPMVRHVQRQFAEIARMAESLERANATLEQQVQERTAELRTAKDAAEGAHVAKSRFLAHASHDLQQPLQAIRMFTGMLERQPQTPKAAAVLADLRGAQRSMGALLNSILEISKLESGVVEPVVAPTPLGPLFERLEAEFGVLADAKGIGLRVVPTSASVLSDPALLERILRNLIANAVRYTESGAVLVGCRRQAGRLRIDVCDTGRGIAEPDRRRIFEEFIQLERPDRDRSEGIGLGLAIVDRLARLLGHGLSVRSVVGRGSTFSVTVPLTSDEPAAA
ncbi:histidine kinase (plasmid) [Azospirillum thermophilum]|uniref:histidine kinase n=2 Tax=Azospirillum thermophilum TaxID=2202148 RepID=A0A2S2CY06_9PROT|nr:histidine kinase [Azospirillum thermophilum]